MDYFSQHSVERAVRVKLDGNSSTILSSMEKKSWTTIQNVFWRPYFMVQYRINIIMIGEIVIWIGPFCYRKFLMNTIIVT